MRLRKRRQYLKISHRATRYVGTWLIIEVCSNRLALTRLGVTVSRRYGKANRRNRFKRIVREAFRLSYPQLPVGLDINIKPRTLSHEAKMPNIKAELLTLLTNHADSTHGIAGAPVKAP